MLEYEIKHDEYDEGEQSLVAVRDEVYYGRLDFGPYEEGSNIFEISSLHSDIERKGIATNLLRRMVEILGEGVPIRSVITHDDTEKVLQELGYFEEAYVNGEVEIVDQELINNLPIVKVRNAGGIFSHRVQVSFDPGGPATNIVIEGITDPQGTYRAALLNDRLNAQVDNEEAF